ncbi:hypothetical protein ACF061_37150 [Streptomyces sp. NPDC015220]|uniref:hypothetical protein n=1 Tax=Streptomyces sp. NPDC015220 TaxID=3364947 RepID=UPI003701DF3D
MTSEQERPHHLAPAHPDGGWGARHPLLTARPLGTSLEQCDEDAFPVTLRSLVLRGERKDSEGVRRRAVRTGLLRLLTAVTSFGPDDLVLDEDLCPECGRAHDFSACGPVGAREHFAVLVHGRHALYAVSRFPVGLAAALPDRSGPSAVSRARKEARLAAHGQAVARGRCARPRDGSVEYGVRYVEASLDAEAVVSVVCELPHAPS